MQMFLNQGLITLLLFHVTKSNSEFLIISRSNFLLNSCILTSLSLLLSMVLISLGIDSPISCISEELIGKEKCALEQ